MTKRKLIKIRKPKLRVTSKGIKLTKPSARIGGKAGLNVSRKGISASVRTKAGTVSTRKGRTTLGKPRWPRKKKGCSLFALLILLMITGSIALGWLILS